MIAKTLIRNIFVFFAVLSCVALHARRDEGLIFYLDFDSESVELKNPAADALGLDEAKLRGNSIKPNIERGKFRNSIAFSNNNAARSINNYSLVIGRLDSTYNNESFSVAFWYRSSKKGATSAAVAGNLDLRNAGENGWAITLAKGRAFVANVGGTKITQAFDEIADGEWHHVAIVLNRATGTITFFGNGKKLSSKKLPNGKIGSGNETFLGSGANGYFGAPGATNAKAFVDDFGIWNRALTDTEIARIWNEGKGARIPEPSIFAFFAGALALGIALAGTRRRRKKTKPVDC